MSSNEDIQEASGSSASTLKLLITRLPQCPVCNANADYSVSHEKKMKVLCNACEAEWKIFPNLSQDEIISLKLERPDKDKKSKALKGSNKVLGFWQHCNIPEYSAAVEKKIKKLFTTYYQINLNRKKNEQAKEELLALGDFVLFNMLSIAAYVFPVYGIATAHPHSLRLVQEFSDLRALPDLLRIYSVTNNSDNRFSIFLAIFKNPVPEGMLPDMVEFYKQAAQTDTNANIRDFSVRALIKYHGKSDVGDLIPFILQVMENEKDVDLRGNNILKLQPMLGDERVIDFLIRSLPDQSTPNVGLELPTSWKEVAKEAIKILRALSIGELAANLLIESGNRRGVENLLDAIVDNKLNTFIFRLKRVKEMFDKYQYAKDYLVEIINTSKNQKRRQNAAGLLKIGGFTLSRE